MLEYPDLCFPLGTSQGHLSEGEENVKDQLFAPGYGQLVFPLQRSVWLRVQGGNFPAKSGPAEVYTFFGLPDLCSHNQYLCAECNAEYFLF